MLMEVKFSNPHSWFIVAVPDENRTAADRAMEGLSPAALISKGVKRSVFRVGDKVSETLNVVNGRPGQ